VRVSVAQVDMCRTVVCVCVCVWLAYEPTEHLFLFMNGLIRVVIFQEDQNPHSAARTVLFTYHLERLEVDRFRIFCLSRDAANKASCNYCQNGVQEQ